jgi:serine/threonine protein kinase
MVSNSICVQVLIKVLDHVNDFSYQAPENFLLKPYGKPVDVFSFGVLLWEMLHCKSAVRIQVHDSIVAKNILR